MNPHLERFGAYKVNEKSTKPCSSNVYSVGVQSFNEFPRFKQTFPLHHRSQPQFDLKYHLCNGNVTVNVVPANFTLTLILPLYISMHLLTIVSPSPVPGMF